MTQKERDEEEKRLLAEQQARLKSTGLGLSQDELQELYRQKYGTQYATAANAAGVTVPNNGLLMTNDERKAVLNEMANPTGTGVKSAVDNTTTKNITNSPAVPINVTGNTEKTQGAKDAFTNLTTFGTNKLPENPTGVTANGNKLPEMATQELSPQDAALEQALEQIEFSTPDVPTSDLSGLPTYTASAVQARQYAYNPLTYDGYRGTVSSPIAGVDQETYDKMFTPFEESQAYRDAMAYADGLLQKLNTGRTQYTDELDSLIKDYKNRGSFEYDPNSDMLYQNYLTAMQNAGQMAMKDTMGQAAALTGGYGSSYSTAAANGAYNNYLQTANDNLVNFYNMAMDKYKLDQDKDLQAIELTKLQDDTVYDRLRDAYSANANRAESIYAKDYQTYADSINQANKAAAMMQNDYWTGEELAQNVELANASNQLNYAKLNENALQYAQDETNAEKWREYQSLMDAAQMENDEKWKQWEAEFKTSEAQRDQDNLDRSYNASKSSSSSSGEAMTGKQKMDMMDDLNGVASANNMDALFSRLYQYQTAYGFDMDYAESIWNAVTKGMSTSYEKVEDKVGKKNDMWRDNNGNLYDYATMYERYLKGLLGDDFGF